MKLEQFSKKLPCYYCGAPPPSSREHAPPDMMLTPFSCGRITVPACNKHNTHKCHRDRAIVTALVRMCCQQSESTTTRKVFSPDIVLAINSLKPNFTQANREVDVRSFLLDPPENFDNDLVYIDPQVDVGGWMRQLTAALVWSVTGKHDKMINWDKAGVWSRHLIPKPYSTQDAGMLFVRLAAKEADYYDHLDWRPGWASIPGYPPDIYAFDLSFLQSKQGNPTKVIFRHQFYASVRWYVEFSASREVRRVLERAIG